MKTSKEVKYMIGLYKKSNEICSTLELVFDTVGFRRFQTKPKNNFY